MSSDPLDIAAFITRWSLVHRGIWRRDHAATAERLHEVLLATIKEVSGQQAEWISHSSTGAAGWLERNRA